MTADDPRHHQTPPPVDLGEEGVFLDATNALYTASVSAAYVPDTGGDSLAVWLGGTTQGHPVNVLHLLTPDGAAALVSTVEQAVREAGDPFLTQYRDALAEHRAS